MTEIPSRLVGDSQGPLDLECGDSLLGLTHQVDGNEPLAKRQVGIVHDGTCRDGELITTGVAVELPTIFNLGHTEGTAPKAGHSIGPAQLLKQFPTLGVGVEIIHKS